MKSYNRLLGDTVIWLWVRIKNAKVDYKSKLFGFNRKSLIFIINIPSLFRHTGELSLIIVIFLKESFILANDLVSCFIFSSSGIAKCRLYIISFKNHLPFFRTLCFTKMHIYALLFIILFDRLKVPYLLPVKMLFLISISKILIKSTSIFHEIPTKTNMFFTKFLHCLL